LTKVQQAVKTLQDVVLVSYSVTPDTDTPSALADFGRERSIDPDRWRLVTGDRQAIWRLARDSYFADDARALGGDPPPEAAFLHTEKVLLVDRQLRLRGVYNGTSASDLEHLVADVRQLEDELGR
jgi:protein SCO1/2